MKISHLLLGLGIAAMTLALQSPVALAANDVSTGIQLADSDGDGELDLLQIFIDNDAGDTWVVNGTPNIVVTQGGEAVTVTSATIPGSATADPVVVYVQVNESTTDVDTNGVTTNAVELTYTQAGGGAGCTNCIRDGGAELTAIASGDGSAASTESDAMQPVVASVSPAKCRPCHHVFRSHEYHLC
jgi:hypothetical protein